MRTDIISFTDRGYELAGLLAEKLGAVAVRCGRECSLGEWVREAFARADALIYVGAVGICVRTIAPYIESKTNDPAVLVIDETGRYVIPILSGHLGGANDLARRIASITGAEAVITTATDRRNVFSVDAWARIQGCHVENPGKIKAVSSKILSDRDIVIESDYPIAGEVPEHVNVRIRKEKADGFTVTGGKSEVKSGPMGNERDVNKENGSLAACGKPEVKSGPMGNPDEAEKENGSLAAGGKEDADVILTIDCEAAGDDNKNSLRIIPKIVCAGVGCRKGISARNVEHAVREAFAQAGVSEHALCGLFSIDLKKDEEGLLEFCRERKIGLVTFAAERLAEVSGEFTQSAFVREITGVDNVCERSAVLGAAINARGTGAKSYTAGVNMEAAASSDRLIFRKHAYDGVTVALAVRDFEPDFVWQEPVQQE